LVLISGSPAAGKTSLAKKLGRRISFPVISRDELKEGLLHGSGGGTPKWGASVAHDAFALFFRLVSECLNSGCSVIAEAAYLVDLTREPSELLVLADACIVHCRVDHDVARRRFVERAASDPLRQASHPDAELISAMEAGTFNWRRYDPMELGIPTMRVDTTDGYVPTLDEIAQFSRLS
jgi:predicted kinase